MWRKPKSYLSKSDYLKKERCFIAKKYKPLQLESIVRGYLSGSAWKSYENRQNKWTSL